MALLRERVKMLEQFNENWKRKDKERKEAEQWGRGQEKGEQE